MMYFAYGSNLDPEQMHVRCPDYRVIGPACLRDWRLCFPRRSPVRGCGTAGIEPAPGEIVWGVLYELTELDVEALHECEGYQAGRPAQENRHEHVEIEVECSVLTNVFASAFAYRALADGSGAMPSADYLAHLLRGALHQGLPDAYIERLRSVRTNITV